MRIDYDNDLRIELPFFLEMVKKLNGSKLRDNLEVAMLLSIFFISVIAIAG